MASHQAAADYADQEFPGVDVAIVSAVEDDPDSLGRVKLKLPWLDSAQETEWCRVVNLFAGNGYGSCWVPEVNDEVLIGFLKGDVTTPVVLGGLYNGLDKPFTTRTSRENRKAFRTKAGHQLIFDDSPGKHAVYLESAKGHKVTLDDDGNLIKLQSAGGHGITIDALSGAVTLKGTTVHIEGDTQVVVTAKQIALN